MGHSGNTFLGLQDFKVLGLGYQPLIAIIMSIITAVGGGSVLDILANRPTLLMTKQLHATPILLVSILYLARRRIAPGFALFWQVAMIGLYGRRASAIYWGLPMFGWLTAESGA